MIRRIYLCCSVLVLAMIAFTPTMMSVNVAEATIAPSTEIAELQFALLPQSDENLERENAIEIDGVTIVSDSKERDGHFTPKLEAFCKEAEELPKDEMFKRAVDYRCLGQRHAQAMLKSQERIPEEWRQYILLFPQTVRQTGCGTKIICMIYPHRVENGEIIYDLGDRWTYSEFAVDLNTIKSNFRFVCQK